MATWKDESQVYKTRLYERYGIIEEKFDKQAFNEDPIAYFESINYELHGTEWISAMWNLLKLAKTDSSFVKKQLGPNGQKVAQILKTIVEKNSWLRDKVAAKIQTITPQLESSADKILMAESASLLKKYDRILDDNILNEGIKEWSTAKKIGVIVIIIGIILIIAGIAHAIITGNASQAGQVASQAGQIVSQVSNSMSIPQEAGGLISRIAQAASNNPERLAILQNFVKVGEAASSSIQKGMNDSALRAAFTNGSIDMSTLQNIIGALGL